MTIDILIQWFCLNGALIFFKNINKNTNYCGILESPQIYGRMQFEAKTSRADYQPIN